MSNKPYEYDENDPALKAVKSEESAALNASDKMFDDAIDANKQKEDSLIGKIEANETELKKAQQAQSDLTIKEIEQEKEYAHKDYIKEQSGAYVDWQKQSNPYGANAEQMAANGMQNTGYSESSQVAMYNAYQNRVAVARESYNRSVVSYNQAIAQARAQNSVALAEIASKALQQSLEVSMNFASLNQNLLSQKASNRNTIANTYASKWAAVLDQLYKEAALAEQKRQHEATLAEQKRQFDVVHSDSDSGSKINKTTISDGSEKKSSSGVNHDIVDSLWGNGKVTTQTKKTDDKKEKDYPVDTASLNACGLSGANAEKIEAEIKAGRLVESVVDGKLTYRRVFAGSIIGGPSLPTATAKQTTTTPKKTVTKKTSRFIYYSDGTKKRIG